jgi:hypothetical protein
VRRTQIHFLAKPIDYLMLEQVVNVVITANRNVGRRPGFDPGSVHVGFMVDKVALGEVFTPSTSVFPCQFHSTGAALLGKTKKLIIFMTGLHNKPQGCGASVASAAGPFSTKK